MTKAMKRSMMTALAVTAATTATTTPVAARAEETRVFACRAKARTVEVVRSGNALAYRCYRGGALELQLSGGTTARTAYSGGGEMQVVFRNGPWTYVVYERTVRTGFDGANDPVSQAGVDVMRSRKVVMRIRCDDQDTQFSAKAFDGLGTGETVEH